MLLFTLFFICITLYITYLLSSLCGWKSSRCFCFFLPHRFVWIFPVGFSLVFMQFSVNDTSHTPILHSFLHSFSPLVIWFDCEAASFRPFCFHPSWLQMLDLRLMPAHSAVLIYLLYRLHRCSGASSWPPRFSGSQETSRTEWSI